MNNNINENICRYKVTTQRKNFHRKSTAFRKDALIRSTLDLIASKGIHATTVRAIAMHANVTPGLIRHYFLTKEDLILVAYEYYMDTILNAVRESLESLQNSTARSRLAMFVMASLTAPVVDPDSIAVWSTFMNRVRYDEKIRSIRESKYYDFRNQLEVLIKDAKVQSGGSTESEQIKRLAMASTAVINGLWQEGCALPDAFAPGEISEIGLQAISAIVGICLTKE
ncbi:MAG: TetR/AcrR family bet gene transcriptional repressor [Saprospiraceae bacterium]